MNPAQPGVFVLGPAELARPLLLPLWAVIVLAIAIILMNSALCCCCFRFRMWQLRQQHLTQLRKMKKKDCQHFETLYFFVIFSESASKSFNRSKANHQRSNSSWNQKDFNKKKENNNKVPHQITTKQQRVFQIQCLTCLQFQQCRPINLHKTGLLDFYLQRFRKNAKKIMKNGP